MNKKQLAVAIACALCVTVSQQAYSANDIEIVSGSDQTNITGGPSFTSTDNSAQLGMDDITTIWDTEVSGTVTVSTAELGLNDQSGDVTFSADLNPPSGYYNDDPFLIINAHNDINLNGAISGHSGLDGFTSIDLIFNADSDGLNGGAVNLNGSMSGYFNTTINGELNISSTGSYTFSHLFQSLTVGSINVEAGGSFNFGGGTTFDDAGDLTLTNSGITIGSGGLLGDTFTLGNFSNLTLVNNNVLTIDSGASFTLDRGQLEVGNIVNAGNFEFVSGQLTLTDSGLTIGSGGLLGDGAVALSRGRNLALSNDNVLTIDVGSSLVVDGGSLIVGSIDNNGSFNYSLGHLGLTNSGLGLTIGDTGLLGDNVALSQTRSLMVAGDVTVNSGATLSVAGNTTNNHFLSNLNNQGIASVNGQLTVDGVITNDGAGSSLTVNGGSLTAGNISNINNGNFSFNSGHLGLTNTGLTVGVGGLLGDNVALSHTRTLAVAGNVNVDSAASLLVGGGASDLQHFSGNLNNQGTTIVANTLTVDGAITNDGAAAEQFMLGGTLTASSISNINGASLYMSAGVIDLGNGAVINDGIDSNMTMAGGTLNASSISNTSDGSFTFDGGHINLSNSDLTLGATGVLGANLTLSGSRTLSISGDMNVENGATLSVTGGSNYPSSSNYNGIAGNLNNSGIVTVATSSSWNEGLRVNGAIVNDGAASSLVLDSGRLIAGSISNINDGSFLFNGGDLELTNSGLTVGATGLLGNDVVLSNRSLLLTSTNLSENVLTVESGANLTLDGGVLRVGSISNSGNFIFNSGSLGLSNSDLTIGSTGLLGNSLTLEAGKSLSLANGVLNVDAGADFTLDGGSLYVSDINNNGSFNFNSGSLTSLGDLTIGGSDTVSLNSGSSLELDTAGSGNTTGVLTLESNASLALNGGYLRLGSISGDGNFSFNSGELLLLDADLIVGAGGLLGNAVTLDADKTLRMSYEKQLIVNAGETFALDGGYLQVGSISNNGNFIFNSGTLNISALHSDMTIGATGLLGDSVVLGADTHLELNSGILTLDAGASLSLSGGSLSVESISDSGGFSFNSGTLLLQGSDLLTIGTGGLLGDSLALSATKDMRTNGSATVDSGAKLSVSGGFSRFRGLTNNGVVNVTGGELASIGDVDNSDRFTVADTASMDIVGSYSQSAGTTNIADGGVMTVRATNSSSYTQSAGKTIVNGRLSAPSVVVNGGHLFGAGVIDGNLTVNGGQINPGNSPGALEITGDFVLTEAGTLHMEIGSDGLDPAGYLYDQLIVGGDYFLQGGLLKFSLLDGIGITDLESNFTIGDFFRNGTTDLDTAFDLLLLSMFDNLDLYAYDVLGDSWFSLALDETGGFLATASASPVPVPAAVWLFGSGLIGLFGVAKRRKAA